MSRRLYSAPAVRIRRMRREFCQGRSLDPDRSRLSRIAGLLGRWDFSEAVEVSAGRRGEGGIEKESSKRVGGLGFGGEVGAHKTDEPAAGHDGLQDQGHVASGLGGRDYARRPGVDGYVT